MQESNSATASKSDFIVKLCLVVIIIILILVYVWPYLSKKLNSWFCKSTEKFVNQNNFVDESVPPQWKQEPVGGIRPPVYDAYTDKIEGGSLFIPQPMFYNTEGTLVQEGNVSTGNLRDLKGLGDEGLNFNLCSPSCCSDQWPVPFKMPVDKMTCQSKDKFVPTSYTCNNGWQDSGCLCMKKEQAEFINLRGLNK